jgi:hypothetical protein
MMKIGFSGTQAGMTEAQKKSFAALIKSFARKSNMEFHHGDCIGADEQAATMVWVYRSDIIVHPPKSGKRRAFFKHYKEQRFPQDYLTRNKNIVKETEFLVATPRTVKEELRSGTWSTVRFAQKQNKKVYIINPNGAIEEREPKESTLPALFK